MGLVLTSWMRVICRGFFRWLWGSIAIIAAAVLLLWITCAYGAYRVTMRSDLVRR
jgi:uncharacterized membrane protein